MPIQLTGRVFVLPEGNKDKVPGGHDYQLEAVIHSDSATTRLVADGEVPVDCLFNIDGKHSGFGGIEISEVASGFPTVYGLRCKCGKSWRMNDQNYYYNDLVCMDTSHVPESERISRE